MTEVITLVIHPRDGVCIEREQPSTAVKPMPAYGALNSSFKAASQPVDVITNDYVTGDGSDQLQLNSNLDKPEADGFLKLGDIKGESVRAPLDVRNPMESSTEELGWWTVDGADFRGIPQDALPNSRAIPGETYIPGDMYHPKNSDGSPAALIDPEYDEHVGVKPAALIDPEYDELVRVGNQVNGTIGYEMQAGLDLRSDNRFVIEPMESITSFGASLNATPEFDSPAGLSGSVIDPGGSPNFAQDPVATSLAF